MKKIIAFLGVSVLVVSAQAELLRYEDFSPTNGFVYAAGVAISTDASLPYQDRLGSTNDWSFSGASSLAPELYDSDLAYSGLFTSNNGYCAYLDNNSAASAGNVSMFFTNTAPTLFLSFLFRVDAGNGVGTAWDDDQTFFHFHNAAIDNNVIGVRESATNGFDLQFAYNSTTYGNGAGAIYTGLTYSNTYLIVLGVTNVGANGQVQMWLNPASLGGAAPTPDAPTTLYRGGGQAIGVVRLGDDDGAAPLAQLYVDDVRVGTTYADVTPQGGALFALTLYADSGGTVSGGGTYPSNANPQIVAVASNNFAFVNWTGALVSANATTNVVMDGDKTVWANFTRTAQPGTLFILK